MPRLLDGYHKDTPTSPAPYAGLAQEIWMPAWWWWHQWRHIPREDRWDYDAMKQHIDTPTQCQAWMYTKLKYRWDIFDTWQEPRATFNKRTGDCEDWALLANDWLRDKYEGHILLMFREENGTHYGHATYLIKLGDKKWISLGTFGKKNHRGAITQIIPNWSPYRHWTRYVLLSPDLARIEETHNKPQ